MRILLTIFTICCFATFANAQSYRNEWIDYSKTYYKFPVRENRVHRITKAVLTTAGIGEIPAEQFQMWRNGEEVAIFTTQDIGPLATGGFIEFVGKANDGKPDTELFDDPKSQVLYDLNYFSDTAWYYLTINTASKNKRITSGINSAATTTLPVDSFYMATLRNYFFYTWNYGQAYILPGPSDAYPPLPSVRSSLINAGEGWTSQPFNKDYPRVVTLTNLQHFPRGGNFQFSYSVSGNYPRTRNIRVFANDSLLNKSLVNGYDMARDTVNNVPISQLKSDAITIKFDSDNDFYWESDFANVFALKYPRKFNFLSSGYTDFELQPKAQGNYLKIGAFRSDNNATILYDLTNNKRYTGIIKGDSSFFAIEPSAVVRTIAISNQVSFLRQVTALTTKKFQSFGDVANQGNYLIITHKLLRTSTGVDQIEEYRKYRSSVTGGNYNAVIYDIDELAEQFAFGLRKHPLAIRNFLRYANDKFAARPKFVYLIGKGTYYEALRVTGNFDGKELISTIPTFGTPGSDNLMAAPNNAAAIPIFPIGRLSAISNEEVGNYLEKVKLYEALINKPNRTTQEAAWEKEFIHIVGSSGDTFGLNAINSTFMAAYTKKINKDLKFATATNFELLPNRNNTIPQDLYHMQEHLDEGVGLISFFGHSSTSSLDYSLSNPKSYNNQNGKFPIFLANGCRAGNIFEFNTNRIRSRETSISDNYIFIKNKGAIVFASNSDVANINYSGVFTDKWYDAAFNTMVGKSIGEVHKEAIRLSIGITGQFDGFMQSETQQMVLHGDPAIIPFPAKDPDYAISVQQIKITPVNPKASDDSVWVKTYFNNIGKSIGDTVLVELKRELPNGEQKVLIRTRLNRLNTIDSVEIKIGLRGLFEAGTNYIIATADPDNAEPELSESNNIARLAFDMNTNAAFPAFPYDLSIVSNNNIVLTASTVDPVAKKESYRIQVDTTRLFNSPLLFTADTSSVGGAINFKPGITWRDNTVYYWRISPITSGVPTQWETSSFLYKNGLGTGFNQSHYFQHTQSLYDRFGLNANTRNFEFGNQLQNLFIQHGIYNTSGTENSHFSLVVNGSRFIESACLGQSIIFNVFDSITFKPWDNKDKSRYGSAATCDYGREYNFEFKYFNHTNRKLIMDFLDSIPKGTYVVARLVADAPYDSLKVQYWKRDTAIYGKGKSLYHALVNQGFKDLDSLNRTRTFGFVFKKDDTVSFKPFSRLSDGIYDRVTESVFVTTKDTFGSLASPLMGPAKRWEQLSWNNFAALGTTNPATTGLIIYGADINGKLTRLDSIPASQKTLDVSTIDANKYPFIQLKMDTKEFKTAKPTQLDFWRLKYSPVADGALSGRDYLLWNYDALLAIKDTLKLGIAYKNISDYSLDSTSFELFLGDSKGNETLVKSGKLKALNAGDTAIISYTRLTNDLFGRYYLKLQVNKERTPIEQTYFNNLAFLPLSVDTSKQAAILDNFDAKAGNNLVNTSWRVLNELKVLRYDVLYGKDSTNMQVILSETAANTGAAITNYSKDHLNPAIGNNYYRLRIIDKFGNATTSAAKLVDVLVTEYASRASANGIQVKWKMKNEVKVNKYDVEYKKLPADWIRIAGANATNTGAATTNYLFDHATPSLGVNYYRMKYTDQYGNTFFTQVDSVSISLNDFAIANVDKNVKVDWRFLNEINVLDFQLEESPDSIRFSLLNTQRSTGNTAGIVTHDYLHSNPAIGYHYYRLKVTDKNGNIIYSPVKKIFVGDETVILVYPNPFTNEIRVVTGDQVNQWQIVLYDAKGQQLGARTGIGTVTIPTTMLPTGIYFLNFQKGDLKLVKKLEKR